LRAKPLLFRGLSGQLQEIGKIWQSARRDVKQFTLQKRALI